LLFKILQVFHNFIDSGAVVLFLGQRQQVGRLNQACRHRLEIDNDLFKLGALLAQRLGTRGVVPDIRLFKLALNLGQALRFGLVVKGTSSAHQSAP
jgi:hypothetical protein